MTDKRKQPKVALRYDRDRTVVYFFTHSEASSSNNLEIRRGPFLTLDLYGKTQFVLPRNFLQPNDVTRRTELLPIDRRLVRKTPRQVLGRRRSFVRDARYFCASRTEL